MLVYEMLIFMLHEIDFRIIQNGMSLELTISLCLSLSSPLSLYLSVPVFVSPTLCLSLSLSLPPYLSPSLSLPTSPQDGRRR